VNDGDAILVRFVLLSVGWVASAFRLLCFRRSAWAAAVVDELVGTADVAEYHLVRSVLEGCGKFQLDLL
jgi:hypothetical protein